MKSGKGLGTLITGHGHEVDVGGPNTNLCPINLAVSFLVVKSSILIIVDVCMRSCLVLEHSMMKSSTLYECGPMSTSH